MGVVDKIRSISGRVILIIFIFYSFCFFWLVEQWCSWMPVYYDVFRLVSSDVLPSSLSEKRCERPKQSVWWRPTILLPQHAPRPVNKARAGQIGQVTKGHLRDLPALRVLWRACWRLVSLWPGCGFQSFPGSVTGFMALRMHSRQVIPCTAQTSQKLRHVSKQQDSLLVVRNIYQEIVDAYIDTTLFYNISLNAVKFKNPLFRQELYFEKYISY